MRSERPDPDQLLKQVSKEDARESRGCLKVFLGASAGVGKTYAMLSEAHEQLARGADVVIGYVETHGRKETEALVEGVPQLTLKKIDYKGVVLKEFDLDGALKRHPEWILVDELPHTNAPGCRHPKRWQDVEELLAAGINVSTAINIQHIESLNDVVAQITGVLVRETVPDALLERADEVELIDIPPEELRQRLREGKVYVPDRIDHALDGFFKKGNLLALRELALRRAADRVEAEMQSFRDNTGGIWATRERVLVCIAPNRLGERVVRAAARLGAAAHAQLFALYVESDRQHNRTSDDQERAEEAIRMAERLGMETARRAGSDIVGEILDFARLKNINLIVVGKPIKARWREVLQGSVVDELVRRSGDISIHVLTGSKDSGQEHRKVRVDTTAFRTQDFYWSAIGPGVATAVGWPIHNLLPPENVISIYLLAIAYVGSKTGPQATAVCCLLSVAAYDFFFVDPKFNFSVTDTRYLPTFFVMFLVALLISSLTQRLRRHADAASARERRTSALYDLSKQLSRSRNRIEIAEATARKMQSELNVDAAVLLPDGKGSLEVTARSRSHFEKDRREFSVAQWSFDNAKPAGSGTDTLPGAVGTYFPLIADRGVLGILACKSIYHDQSLESGQHPLLQTFANSMSLALERASLAKENHEARLTAESERIRSSLLSSVSHDIRTPLTAITGAASALIADQGDRVVLAQTIFDEAQRLNRQVRNLLDMTRLESGALQPKLEWHNPEELVGSAIRRAETTLAGRELGIDIPEDFPLVKADGMLVEQALVNLLENAGRHTPEGSPIDIRVAKESNELKIYVMDRGPGVPSAVRPHLFEKFTQERSQSDGFGLGLAITSAAMKVQGGSATMEDRPGGGSMFILTMPMIESAPEVPVG
jgi:two-component system sensor histidine kinase KdpD